MRNDTYLNRICQEEGYLAGPNSTGMYVFAAIVLTHGSFSYSWGILYFLRERKKSQILSQGNLSLQIASVGISFFQYFAGILRTFIGPDRYSCKWLGLLQNFGLLVSINFGLAFLLATLWKINYNQRLIDESYSELVAGAAKSGSEGKLPLGNRLYKPQVFALSGDEPRRTHLISGHRYEILRDKAIELLFKATNWKPPKHLPEKVRFPHFLASSYFINLFTLGTSLLVVVSIQTRMETVFRGSVECTGCLTRAKYYMLPVGIYFPMVFGVFFFFVLYLLRNIPDSMRVRYHLFVVAAFYLGVFIVSLIFMSTTASLEERGVFQSTLVESLMHSCFVYVYLIYQVHLVRSQASTINDQGITLQSILDSTEGRKVFSLYLVSILSLETLLFYLEAVEWYENFENLSQDELKVKANKIYDKFIGADALLLINIPSEMHDKLCEDIHKNLYKELFEGAKKEMVYLMSAHLFPGFTKSTYFKNYIRQSSYL